MSDEISSYANSLPVLSFPIGYSPFLSMTYYLHRYHPVRTWAISVITGMVRNLRFQANFRLIVYRTSITRFLHPHRKNCLQQGSYTMRAGGNSISAPLSQSLLFKKWYDFHSLPFLSLPLPWYAIGIHKNISYYHCIQETREA